jgi:hypothetical protein
VVPECLVTCSGLGSTRAAMDPSIADSIGHGMNTSEVSPARKLHPLSLFDRKPLLLLTLVKEKVLPRLDPRLSLTN